MSGVTAAEKAALLRTRPLAAWERRAADLIDFSETLAKDDDGRVRWPSLAGVLEAQVRDLCSQLAEFDAPDPVDGQEHYEVEVYGATMVAVIAYDEDDADGWSVVGLLHCGEDIKDALSEEVLENVEDQVREELSAINASALADYYAAQEAA